MNKWTVLKTSGVLFMIFSLADICWAEPTDITVRVISRDAKFIGTSMGGVLVTVSDAQTGEILSQGKTAGGTGDTNRIIKQPHKRGVPLSTESAAKFSATLELKEPRLIEVTAFGPLGQRQGANRVSAVQWVVPGKHLTGGDGWLLEMPGFIVDVLAPPTHLKLKGTPQTVELKAKVTMMCGCPIEPGGFWDANRYEVTALIRKNGEPFGKALLKYAGATSQFAGTMKVEAPGTYEAVVYAYDSSNGNTGLDKVTFVVSR
ncbi:MAG: hypothetical protein NPINA01_02440 [Nitrospinaceae bacterium]|nr:MAG: hypothetical protein NPINA01_02440 [Nitrospinaceae bacterium]